jgi:hypothetical protein
MSENLLNVLERFCDELPDTVRDDLLFMMVMLLDPNERFGLDGPQLECSRQQSDPTQSRVHDRYADRRRAILAAKQVWMELRRTTLSPEAIATALVPINARPHGGHSALGWDSSMAR